MESKIRPLIPLTVSCPFLFLDLLSSRLTILPLAFTEGTRLEIKRIDKVRIPTTGKWVILENNEPVSNDMEDKYAEYAFLVRREVLQTRESDFPTITTEIPIRSDYLHRTLKHVMKDVQNLSWTARPFKVMLFLIP